MRPAFFSLKKFVYFLVKAENEGSSVNGQKLVSVIGSMLVLMLLIVQLPVLYIV